MRSPGQKAGLATRINKIQWWRPSSACRLWRCELDGKQPLSPILWTSRSRACSWVNPGCVGADNNPWRLWSVLHDNLCTCAAYHQALALIILVKQNFFERAEFNLRASPCLSASEGLLPPAGRFSMVSGTVFCHFGSFQFQHWCAFHSANLQMLARWRGLANLSTSLESHLAVRLSEVYRHCRGGVLWSRRPVSISGQTRF